MNNSLFYFANSEGESLKEKTIIVSHHYGDQFLF